MEQARTSLPPLSIMAYSDFYSDPDPKVWGDYWIKVRLAEGFMKLGCPVDDSREKIVLHLFGEPLRIPVPGAYRILWIHSHPDWISAEILGQYHKIYCISESFCNGMSQQGFDAEFMMLPTHLQPAKAEKKYDIVFVGNTKGAKIRKVVRDMGAIPYSVKIWGAGWKGLIPDEWYGGDYYDNSRLSELYASSRIVLNDHHEDMRREGFINPRIIDVLASGGFVISDSVRGMESLLGDSVVTYDTPDDLRVKIDFFMANDDERMKRIKRGQEIALGFTYDGCCKKIMDHIASISDTVSL